MTTKIQSKEELEQLSLRQLNAKLREIHEKTKALMQRSKLEDKTSGQQRYELSADDRPILEDLEDEFDAVYDVYEQKFQPEEDTSRLNALLERGGGVEKIRRILSNGGVGALTPRIGSFNGKPLQDVMNWYRQADLKQTIDSRGLTTGDADQAGNLIPERTFQETIITSLRERIALFDIAGLIPTRSGEQLKWPRQTGYITPAVKAQGATAPETLPAFDAFITLVAHTYVGLVGYSNEFDVDYTPGFDGWLTPSLITALRRDINEDFVTGDGASKPKGVAHATLGAATGVNAVSQTALDFEEIINLYYEVPEDYADVGTWLMARRTLRDVRLLTNGNGEYIWERSLIDGNRILIEGRPVRTDVHMPSVAASNKAIIFGDFKTGYWIRVVNGIEIQKDESVAFKEYQTVVRGVLRADGAVADPAALRALQMAA